MNKFEGKTQGGFSIHVCPSAIDFSALLVKWITLYKLRPNQYNVLRVHFLLWEKPFHNQVSPTRILVLRHSTWKCNLINIGCVSITEACHSRKWTILLRWWMQGLIRHHISHDFIFSCNHVDDWIFLIMYAQLD